MPLHGQERGQLLHDRLLADAAEWLVDVAHAAVVFGAVDVAVVVIGAFEEADRSHRDG